MPTAASKIAFRVIISASFYAHTSVRRHENTTRHATRRRFDIPAPPAPLADDNA
jgi:hypothetical protein